MGMKSRNKWLKRARWYLKFANDKNDAAMKQMEKRFGHRQEFVDAIRCVQ